MAILINGMHNNTHSVYLLQYHVVLVTKFRNPVLKGKVKESVYGTLKETLEMMNAHLLKINGEADHVHLLIETTPDVNLFTLMKTIKTRSARFARRDYPEEVAKYYWKNFFWSNGYFISTVSENTLANVKKYIQNQGMKTKNQMV